MSNLFFKILNIFIYNVAFVCYMLCINYTNGGTFSTSFIAPSAL
nr:MAG TPA: hypothetical protein [Caudoviricetes sp.]